MRLLRAVALSVLAMACSGPVATPTGGPAQRQAEAAAGSAFPATGPIIDATAAQIGSFDSSNIPANTWVWAVVMEGSLSAVVQPPPLA